MFTSVHRNYVEPTRQSLGEHFGRAGTDMVFPWYQWYHTSKVASTGLQNDHINGSGMVEI